MARKSPALTIILWFWSLRWFRVLFQPPPLGQPHSPFVLIIGLLILTKQFGGWWGKYKGTRNAEDERGRLKLAAGTTHTHTREKEKKPAFFTQVGAQPRNFMFSR